MKTNDEDGALLAADKQLSANGRSFHWARRFLGGQHADRATRLYGLCRYLDDLADGAASPAEARVKFFQIASEIASGHSEDPVLGDGLLLMKECRIPRSVIMEFIKGLSSDLDPVRVESVDSLLRYCYQVAGTVGIMMCGALDVVEERAFAHAMDLGIAMQLTNICRDVSEDGAAGRRYLPATLIGDIPPEKLVRPASTLQFPVKRCVAELLQLADRYYRSGEQGLKYLPLRARGGILVAGRVYRAIGTKLRKRDFDYWTGRVVVSGMQKIILTAQTLGSVPSLLGFVAFRERHEAKLHQPLAGLPFADNDYAE